MKRLHATPSSTASCQAGPSNLASAAGASRRAWVLGDEMGCIHGPSVHPSHGVCTRVRARFVAQIPGLAGAAGLDASAAYSSSTTPGLCYGGFPDPASPVPGRPSRRSPDTPAPGAVGGRARIAAQGCDDEAIAIPLGLSRPAGGTSSRGRRRCSRPKIRDGASPSLQPWRIVKGGWMPVSGVRRPSPARRTHHAAPPRSRS